MIERFIKNNAIEIIVALILLSIVSIVRYEARIDNLKSNYNACQSNIEDLTVEYNKEE